MTVKELKALPNKELVKEMERASFWVSKNDCGVACKALDRVEKELLERLGKE